MERERRQRLALRWGGLALVAQLWLALVLLRRFLFDWDEAQAKLCTFAQSMDNFSQLKPPFLKYPTAAVYVVGFVVMLVGILVWLATCGLRDAMAPEPPPDPRDLDDEDR